MVCFPSHFGIFFFSMHVQSARPGLSFRTSKVCFEFSIILIISVSPLSKAEIAVLIRLEFALQFDLI